MIPDDILKIAARITVEIPRVPKAHKPYVMNKIAMAIFAERERCAAIAEAWKGHPADFHFAGKQVAAAIRSSSDTGKE